MTENKEPRIRMADINFAGKLYINNSHESCILADLEAEANRQLQPYLDRIKELEAAIERQTALTMSLSTKLIKLEADRLTPEELDHLRICGFRKIPVCAMCDSIHSKLKRQVEK
jgi:hypothetical protein